MRIHILGTASGRPTTHRDVSGTVIQTPVGVVAIDPGEGFQQRVLRQAKVMTPTLLEWRPRVSRIDAILLTHGHLDHIAGVLPMIHSMGLDGRKRPLDVIGPSESSPNNGDEGPFDLANQFNMMQHSGATEEVLGFPIVFRTVRPEDKDVITVGKGLRCRPWGTDHRVTSCAWDVSLSDKRGGVDTNALDALQLDDVKRAKLFQDGQIELRDGQIIQADDLRGPERRGLRVVISGDTTGKKCGFDELDEPVDILIHEATYTDEHTERAKRNTHATARDAGRRARVMKAHLLVLTHFSARLKDVTQSVDEAASEHASVMAAEDGDILQLDEKNIDLLRITDGEHKSARSITSDT